MRAAPDRVRIHAATAGHSAISPAVTGSTHEAAVTNVRDVVIIGIHDDAKPWG
jgi:hypothetical protein